MKFSDIPQMTRANYAVDIDWDFLESWLLSLGDGHEINYDPDYQRDHVWTEFQQIAYVEFKLKGGRSGGNIYWNSPTFVSGGVGDIDLVDGKQRLNAVLRFLRNEIKCLGFYFKEFEGPFRCLGNNSFRVHINNLETRKEVLQWYLDLNAGIAHTTKELDKVKNMLANCEKEESK